MRETVAAVRRCAPLGSLVLAAVLGCRGDETLQDSQSSPSETHTRFRKALERSDWRQLYSTLSPQSRSRTMVGMILWSPMGASNEAEEAALRKVFERNGLDQQRVVESILNQRERTPDASVRNAVPDAGSRVSLFADLMQWHVDNVPASEAAEFVRVRVGPLTDVQVEGDRGIGRHSVRRPDSPENAGALSRPVYFQKIDGVWYIDLGAPEKSGAASSNQTDDIPLRAPERTTDEARGQ